MKQPNWKVDENICPKTMDRDNVLLREEKALRRAIAQTTERVYRGVCRDTGSHLRRRQGSSIFRKIKSPPTS